MSFKDTYGPWCLILGGSEGIGSALAREVAARGLNVFLVARKREALEDVADGIRADCPGVEVRTLATDLAVPDSARTVIEATRGLEVGLFIYNAGAETVFADFLDQPWAQVFGRLQRNFVVKTELLHHFGRDMRPRKRGGVIIMGSIAGFFGSPGFSLYAASKAFTQFLTEGLWHELGQDNIDVLCPVVGPTDTPAMINAYGPMEGHKTDPVHVARSALAHLRDGPIWIAEDVADMIAEISAKPSRERAEFGAAMGREFAKNVVRS
ncbi:MAG: SDR family NAD(P)-dependent oxidoreductase [Novosphingobium sp.]